MLNTRLQNPPTDEQLRAQGRQYAPAIKHILQSAGLNPIQRWQTLLENVACCSPFLGGLFGSQPELLRGLLSSEELIQPTTPDYYQIRLPPAAVQATMSEAEWMAMLRRFRNREIMRIGIKDLLGWADLPETLYSLSLLADTCVRAALHKAEQVMTALHGYALDDQGQFQHLWVLAMGKLGAGELNYSSDIDLIFVYATNGDTQADVAVGQRSLEHHVFFARIGQRLIKYLHETTQDGFVFRVDMRLRPYGDSGPLVMSLSALETYYQSQGRDWERYALVKARVINLDDCAVRELEKIFKPFVYRRYLDYGAFEALREMKSLILQETTREKLHQNIKLGPGGIREIEFIVQAFQLIRGGREADLQQRSLLKVLKILSQRRILSNETAEGLKNAYIFLRNTENRLQMMDDQQRHHLPQQPLEKARLAYAMGHAQWEAFYAELSQHVAVVHDCFIEIFSNAVRGDDASAENNFGLKEVWQGFHGASAEMQLRACGYDTPLFIMEGLSKLRNSAVVNKMSVRARQRLDRLMPLMLEMAGKQRMDHASFDSLLMFVRTVARRSVYLALLVEYPLALGRLIKFFSASSWLAGYLTRYPILLDSLIDEREIYQLPERSQLQAQLKMRLQTGMQNRQEDSEWQWEILRQFKNEQVLRIAVADIDGVLPLMKVSDRLSELAEVMLEQAYQLAWEELRQRYGEPCCVCNGIERPAQMWVVAYGKLGGIELGYGSDLDIIFLHDSEGESQHTQGMEPLPNVDFFLHLARKLVRILTTATPNGILYDIDLRLRPDGASGLMVHSLQGFAQYQQAKAWTWEHQALVRARLVVGDNEARQCFEDLRHNLLCQSRQLEHLRNEILEMRARMRSSAAPEKFDLKLGRGGIVDIEFMVQYMALAHASDYPEIVRYTDNIRILEACSKAGVLAPKKANFLIDAYRQLRTRLHRLALSNRAAVVDENDALQPTWQAVHRLWLDMFGATFNYEE